VSHVPSWSPSSSWSKNAGESPDRRNTAVTPAVGRFLREPPFPRVVFVFDLVLTPPDAPQSPLNEACKAYGVTGASYDRSTRQFRPNARWLTRAFAHLVRKRLAGTAPVSERRCKSAGRYPARAQRGGVAKPISKRSAVPLGAALLLCLLHRVRCPAPSAPLPLPPLLGLTADG